MVIFLNFSYGSEYLDDHYLELDSDLLPEIIFHDSIPLKFLEEIWVKNSLQKKRLSSKFPNLAHIIKVRKKISI